MKGRFSTVGRWLNYNSSYVFFFITILSLAGLLRFRHSLNKIESGTQPRIEFASHAYTITQLADTLKAFGIFSRVFYDSIALTLSPVHFEERPYTGKEALEFMLKETLFDYSIRRNTATIFHTEKYQKLRGRVSDSKGNPIVGVLVCFSKCDGSEIMSDGYGVFEVLSNPKTDSLLYLSWDHVGSVIDLNELKDLNKIQLTLSHVDDGGESVRLQIDDASKVLSTAFTESE